MPTEAQEQAELLRQCIASGQASAAQIVAHEDEWRPADIEASGEWSEAL